MKEYYRAAAQRDELVWETCVYLEHHNPDFICRKCPAWEIEEGSKVKRLCRSLAEEVIAKVLCEFTENPLVTFRLGDASADPE
jgi:hypothetical protein